VGDSVYAIANIAPEYLRRCGGHWYNAPSPPENTRVHQYIGYPVQQQFSALQLLTAVAPNLAI